MVVRPSRMEVPAARFDEGGGGKVQELLGSMEVLWHEQIERSSLGDALLKEENCRCGLGQGRSLGVLGEVLLEVVDGDERSRGGACGHVQASGKQRRFERPSDAEDGGAVLLGFGCEGRRQARAAAVAFDGCVRFLR